jgi:hypothetical protein
MSWSNFAGVSALLQELLDHTQGDRETAGNLGAGTPGVVIRGKDKAYRTPFRMATLFIEML